MAAFRQDDEDALDWRILQDGGICIYRNPMLLEEDISWFKQHSYHIYSFYCGNWTSVESLHTSLQETLCFPAYYGRNTNALLDCLRDFEVPDSGGAVIVLNAFTQYVCNNDSSDTAEGLLNVFAIASRYFILFGRRLIILVQSDDPKMHYEGLAAVATHWNRREWLNKDRGL